MVASSMVDHHQQQHSNRNNSHHPQSVPVVESGVASGIIDEQQQQLYYAQLLAAQQQAIALSLEASGGGMGDHHQQQTDDAGGEKNAREERERREREGSERNTNLIINYLPQNMSQEEVRALFNSMGEVESCKLIRDKATGQSLGYAFVNFERPEDARKALTSMNGLRLQNKVLKVSLARPSKEDIKGANLYVSGLPKSLTQPELEAAFRPFGSIITSRILSDNVTGLSKGVGFVRFDRKCEAEIAIEKMSGSSPWGGEEIIAVKFANSPSANSAKSTAIQMAQAMSLPLQMLQGVSSGNVASGGALSLPVGTPLLSATSATGGAHQSFAGGPIHTHTPQHRFRYSPLAGAPLISGATTSMIPTAATVVSAAAGLPALSSLNPSLMPSGGVPSSAGAASFVAQLGQEYYTAAALQQQLLQQQLNAYSQSLAASTNPSAALNMAAAQQQYAAYAAAIAAAASASGGGQQQCQQQNGASPSSSSGWTLSVHNLGSDAGEPTLWRLFGPFGAVLSVKQMSKGKGQAAVSMANYEEATVAANALNGTQMGGRTLQVSLKSLPSLIR